MIVIYAPTLQTALAAHLVTSLMASVSLSVPTTPIQSQGTASRVKTDALGVKEMAQFHVIRVIILLTLSDFLDQNVEFLNVFQGPIYQWLSAQTVTQAARNVLDPIARSAKDVLKALLEME